MPNDFELKFEWKGTMSVNGGFQYRSYMTNDLGERSPVAFINILVAAVHAADRAAVGVEGRGGVDVEKFLRSAHRGGGGTRGVLDAAADGQMRPRPAIPAPGAPSAEEIAKYDMSGPAGRFRCEQPMFTPGAYYREQHGRSTVRGALARLFLMTWTQKRTLLS